jgi:hypothetical protein
MVVTAALQEAAYLALDLFGGFSRVLQQPLKTEP